MSLSIKADRTLVWDNDQARMVVKTRVTVRLLGNRGSIYAEEGPLYVDTAREVMEAAQLLQTRLVQSLPGIG